MQLYSPRTASRGESYSRCSFPTTRGSSRRRLPLSNSDSQRLASKSIDHSQAQPEKPFLRFRAEPGEKKHRQLPLNALSSILPYQHYLLFLGVRGSKRDSHHMTILETLHTHPLIKTC